MFSLLINDSIRVPCDKSRHNYNTRPITEKKNDDRGNSYSLVLRDEDHLNRLWSMFQARKHLIVCCASLLWSKSNMLFTLFFPKQTLASDRFIIPSRLINQQDTVAASWGKLHQAEQEKKLHPRHWNCWKSICRSHHILPRWFVSSMLLIDSLV